MRSTLLRKSWIVVGLFLLTCVAAASAWIRPRAKSGRTKDLKSVMKMGAGNRVDRNSSNLAWSREQTTATNRIQVAMTKDRVLLITFSPLPTVRSPMLNFYATVRNEEDIADTLLMVMGYRP